MSIFPAAALLSMLTAAIGCAPDLQLSSQRLSAQHLTGSCRLSIFPAASLLSM
jgi:hypothetical protein